jgi:hypothetical protein
MFKTVKPALRLLSLALILGSAGYWLATGANRGWTKNKIPIKTVDEVTGIEGTTYQDKFVPGVDFLAVTVGAGLLCGGASFLFRTKHPPQSSNEQTSNS